MKILLFSISVMAGMLGTTGQADTWTWAAIGNGLTLDAHLGRCDFGRPNPLIIFSTIVEIQENWVAPNENLVSPRS